MVARGGTSPALVAVPEQKDTRTDSTDRGVDREEVPPGRDEEVFDAGLCALYQSVGSSERTSTTKTKGPRGRYTSFSRPAAIGSYM